MITAWLSAMGLPRWAWKLVTAVVALAILGALWLWLDAREASDDRDNQEIGASVQRQADQREIIKQVETGNAARDEIGQAGPAGNRVRYDQCVRTARTPANCERLLPERQAD